MDTNRVKPLVERAMAGDKKAYAQLCEEIVGDVLYTCTKLTGDKQDGEDAAQETLLQLGSAVKKLRDAQAFPAWLHRCIIGVCGNMVRKDKRQKGRQTQALGEDIVEKNPEFLPEEWAEQGEKREMVLSCIRELPTRQQHILLMYYFEGLPLRDIAVAHKISEDAARAGLYRARKGLKRSVERRSGKAMGLRAVGATPTLALIFQRDAQQDIDPERVRGILQTIGAALGTAGTAAAASALPVAGIVLGAAPVALGFLLAATLLIGSSSQSPGQLHEPTGLEYVPQHSEVLEAGSAGREDVLNTTRPQDISGASPSAPEVSSATSSQPDEQDLSDRGEEDVAAFVAVRGRVQLVDGAGAPLSAPALDLSGIEVEGLDENGNTVASARTTADGSYQIELPRTGTYTLRTVAQAHRPYLCAGEVVWTNGQSPAAIAVRDLSAPQCALEFENANGERQGALNPSAVRAYVTDETPCTVRWTVRRSGETNVLAGGSGSYASLAQLAPGRYTVEFTVTDLGGNVTSEQRECIVRTTT